MCLGFVYLKEIKDDWAIKDKTSKSVIAGLRTPAHDPLNARSAYSNVLKDNKKILEGEHKKLTGSKPFGTGKIINLKG